MIKEVKAEYAIFVNDNLCDDCIETEEKLNKMMLIRIKEYPHSNVTASLLTECERRKYYE